MSMWQGARIRRSDLREVDEEPDRESDHGRRSARRDRRHRSGLRNPGGGAVPVIFLTGHSDTATLQRAVMTGPLGYLTKPFQEADLRGAIEVAIHKHRADIERREREEHLRRSAENRSLIDELTQLNNRRGFFELGGQALETARSEQHVLGLFFMLALVAAVSGASPRK